MNILRMPLCRRKGKSGVPPGRAVMKPEVTQKTMIPLLMIIVRRRRMKTSPVLIRTMGIFVFALLLISFMRFIYFHPLPELYTRVRGSL